MSVIDDYLKNVSEPERLELQRIRAIIKEAAPDAEEVITYGMPGYKYKKKYLISFGVFKNHMSLFPGSEPVAQLKEELGSHFQSKGTIQFTVDDPLTEEMIKKIVDACVARAEA